MSNKHFFSESLLELLFQATESKASDLHLSAGLPPALRKQNELIFLNLPLFSHTQLIHLLTPMLDPIQQDALEKKTEIDFSCPLNKEWRCRGNIYYQHRGIAASFRLIPTQPPQLNQIGLPPVFESFCSNKQGLILITGATGSGKSTTLAAMIQHMNQHQRKHIITIEDPIEFIYQSNQSLITQRELNQTTNSFHQALRAALRQDPDVILIGELRDLDTIRLALTAAETGHLVLATLHTNSAAKAIARITDAFPGNEKETIRLQLSESLNTVVAQQLCLRERNLHPAFEILICTPAIRHLIRENKPAQIYSTMQTGQALGMCTMEQYLLNFQMNPK